MSGILIVSENRLAFREYEVIDRYEAGIVLTGPEVKAIRDNKINLKDAYVRIVKNEAFLLNCHIDPYLNARLEEQKALRERKLLLSKKEISDLNEAQTRKGLSIIALKAYFKEGLCKVEIATAKGRKFHDKREAVKEREVNRDMQRQIKGR
jgi:SsrA-binding protein